MRKGQKMSSESRQKMSLARKNEWETGKRKPHPAWNKGLHIRLNPLGEFKKGMIPWNKGVKMSAEGRKKNSESHKGVMKWGKHPMWKGNNYSYAALHQWVRRWKGKTNICEHCGGYFKGKQIGWANIDHTYKRKLEDFIRLCSKCHQKYDIENNQYNFFNKFGYNNDCGKSS